MGDASPAAGTISARIAEYLADLRLTTQPPEVVQFAKHVLLDCVGCILAGLDTPSGRAAVAFGRECRPGEARLADGGPPVPFEVAAFVNTVLCNALDFEPVGPEGHMGAVAVPSALALAEARAASGAALLLAVIAGLEVGGRIGAALRRPSSVAAGGMPPVRGTPHAIFAAVAPAALLLGLDREQTRNALGIAAYSAHLPTLRKAMSLADPPMTKYDHLGGMARGGIDAARLARHGFTGDVTAFEGDDGLWRFSGALGCDWSLLERFGGTWMIAPTFFKTYPCVVYQNPGPILVRRIVEEQRLAPAAIERIILRPSRASHGQRSDGRGSAMAQWISTPLNVAHAVCGTRPFSAWQTGEPPPDAVIELAAKVTFEPYVPDGTPAGTYWDGYNPVSVSVLAGGKRYDGEMRDLPRLDEAQLVAKFIENATPRLGAQAHALAERLLHVEDEPRAADLLP